MAYDGLTQMIRIYHADEKSWNVIQTLLHVESLAPVMILGLSHSPSNKELFPVVLKLLPTGNKIEFQANYFKRAPGGGVVDTEAGDFEWTQKEMTSSLRYSSIRSVSGFVSFVMEDYVQLPQKCIDTLSKDCLVEHPDKPHGRISVSCKCQHLIFNFKKKGKNVASLSLTLKDLMHDEEPDSAGMCRTVIQAAPHNALEPEADTVKIGLSALKSKYVVIDEYGYHIVDENVQEASSTSDSVDVLT
uniref:AlNc14C21G2213 protein n=1 Tax=Albugo laibachii Nc14 TaxID=890382 RepID=F0W5P8_9STRA|nr:AlNc14C21G2213 [Albugo laibachii Nc14]|eukprot:CCA16439.1 AlNc14C21G2213 [Albugo laibachii Nc14]